MNENTTSTSTALESLQQKLEFQRGQLVDFTREVDFWQLSLDELDAMPEGEDKQLMEGSMRQHFVDTLAHTKRERLKVQIWISSIERQIQALQQQ